MTRGYDADECEMLMPMPNTDDAQDPSPKNKIERNKKEIGAKPIQTCSPKDPDPNLLLCINASRDVPPMP